MYAICRYYVGKIFLKPLDFSKLSQNYVGMYAILSKKKKKIKERILMKQLTIARILGVLYIRGYVPVIHNRWKRRLSINNRDFPR